MDWHLNQQAEARAEFAERSVQKLQKEVDRLEGKFILFQSIIHLSEVILDELSLTCTVVVNIQMSWYTRRRNTSISLTIWIILSLSWPDIKPRNSLNRLYSCQILHLYCKLIIDYAPTNITKSINKQHQQTATNYRLACWSLSSEIYMMKIWSVYCHPAI